ncbi:MAG TPA: shikimate dehydrogenase [Elusimicrobia bacterium]|nr:shikimate dehydrogenase [Elusimicrobiota bacterium]
MSDRAGFRSDRPMKLGLFGRSVSRSRSPRLFARLSRLLKRPISYAAVEVHPGELGAAVATARDAGWRGVNVTSPLKEEAAALPDSLTPEARALGAVNVLRFGRTIVGHNSDGEGLRDALRRAGVAVRGKDALVFGAGGAARAAGWAMGKEVARRVRFAARTTSRARRAARDLGKIFPRTEFSAGSPVAAHLWVNATPLGMHGFPDRSPAPKSLPSPEAAIDLVYGRRTAFQRDASVRGARIEDGAPMLVFQALRAWESWDRPLGAVRRAKLAEQLLQDAMLAKQ